MKTQIVLIILAECVILICHFLLKIYVLISRGWLNNVLFSFFFFLLLAGLSPLPVESAEISYPERPINLIVPYPPGGSSDLGTRLVADKIQEILGKPIISVHKPGGGGSLGAAFAAKAKPDGYTILFGPTTPVILSPIVKKLDYTLDDFIPTGMYGKLPFWLAVKPEARWKTLKEFVEEAKKSPGKLMVGTYGKLTAADFLIELLNKHAGIKLTNVPFKSSLESLTAVIGGKIDSAMAAGGASFVMSGQVRLLATAEERRLEDLPDVPTFKELGYPLLITGRNSLWFPKGTPKEIVDKFAKAQETAFTRYPKEIKDGLRKIEMYAEYLSPEDTMREFKKEYDLLYRIAEELGVVAKE